MLHIRNFVFFGIEWSFSKKQNGKHTFFIRKNMGPLSVHGRMLTTKKSKYKTIAWEKNNF